MAKPAESRHERTDIKVGLLVKLGLTGLAMAIVIVIGVLLLFRNIVSREDALEEPLSPLAASPSEYPGPKLQVDPPQELQEVLAAERDILTSYGWIDREAGVVRIPIEEAMRLLAERGLPSREGALR